MLQFFLIIVVFYLSTLLGIRIGRFSGKKWTLGFFIGLAILAVISLPRFIPTLIDTDFYHAILSNNIDATLLCISGLISILPCLPKLSGARIKFLVVSFLLISMLRTSVLPAACFFFNRNELSNLSGRVDSDGVYLQTTGYTCGPAAAATVLKACGFNDSEKNIALDTGCNSYSGTSSLDLVNYINTNYGLKLKAEYRYIQELDSLKDIDGFFIAEVRAGTFTDHFVAIMNFDGENLTIADPSFGEFTSTKDKFVRNWKNKVIVVTRQHS